MEERYEIFEARKASVGRSGHQGSRTRGRYARAANGDYQKLACLAGRRLFSGRGSTGSWSFPLPWSERRGFLCTKWPHRLANKTDEQVTAKPCGCHRVSVCSRAPAYYPSCSGSAFRCAPLQLPKPCPAELPGIILVGGPQNLCSRAVLFWVLRLRPCAASPLRRLRPCAA
jgi:hypothetical protein